MRRESHVRFCEGGGVRLPSATRLVRLIKEECFERMILCGERHLRRTIAEFVAQAQLRGHRIRLTDDQRRRLAVQPGCSCKLIAPKGKPRGDDRDDGNSNYLSDRRNHSLKERSAKNATH
jgi:hypothetical protein